MTVSSGLFKGPAAYDARSNWPAWAVLPAGVVIFALAGLLGAGLAAAYAWLAGAHLPARVGPADRPPELMGHLAVFAVGLELGIVGLTWIAAGFFSTPRAQALALRTPAGGWGVMLLAPVPLFVAAAITFPLRLFWLPETLQDIQPYHELLNGHWWLTMLAAICIGAPFAEELFFRGFLFSGLASTRLGLVGTAVLTNALWLGVHAGYSIFGLAEVFCIGLYFSWLLVRTGSQWVTIFCHAVYNFAMAIALFTVTLPVAG